MFKYIVRRIPYLFIVILGVSIITFLILHLTGDPAQLLLPPNATEQDINEFRHRLGFDDPLYVQYFRFIKGVVHGDFGLSMVYRRPAFEVVMNRFPATVELALTSMFFAIFIAVPMGIVSALKRNTIIDYFVMIFTLGGQSMPTFWLGIMLIMIFGVKIDLLPTYGRGTWQHIILPTISLGTFYLAMISRLTRSSLLEVLSKDYIRTARAKGVKERMVVLKHALKNSLIPIITVVGMQFGKLLGGAVVTESVFQWPGVGKLVITAINQRDYPIVQTVIFILALSFVLMNLLTDLSYAYLDPRIKYD
jgi:peptide/nickel transport system permease protein